MLKGEEEVEDDVSFYVQNNESNKLKPVSGTNTYENLADQRIKTNREPLPINNDEYNHQPRVRRPSIVIREHQLSQYPVNYDPTPEIIRKKIDDYHEPIVYKQQIAVRYLCPPTPPPPAPLIIREIRPPQLEALPPIIIRQRPPPPVTPPPIIIRERPPTPPSYTTPQIIYKQVSPIQSTQRRVIIERLPPMPAKPPNIIVERWLPYKQQKRQVIYEKTLSIDEKNITSNIDAKTQNDLIIQYANPSVRVEKQMRSLGIVRCDPYENKQNSNLSSPKNNEPIYHNYSPSNTQHSKQLSD